MRHSRSGKSQLRKMDTMRQLDFWGITAMVLEQVTGSRAPKVGVVRPLFTVAQESFFDYIERPWEEVRQHYSRKYSSELPEEAPANRMAIVLEGATRGGLCELLSQARDAPLKSVRRRSRSMRA